LAGKARSTNVVTKNSEWSVGDDMGDGDVAGAAALSEDGP